MSHSRRTAWCRKGDRHSWISERAREKGQLKTAAWPTLSLVRPNGRNGRSRLDRGHVLASSEQRAPHDIAQIIVENLPQRDQLFDRVEIVKPGFLNLTVKPALWQETLREIEQQGASYGTTDVGKGQRALVEYVSANPTGPLHVGHGRGAAVGQAVASLLNAVGFEVVSEYYINDAGRQMKLLGASVTARYRELKASPPASGRRVSRRLHYGAGGASHTRARCGKSLSAEQLEERCRSLAYQELLSLIREDLKAGIEFSRGSRSVTAVLTGRRAECWTSCPASLYLNRTGLWFRSSIWDEKDRVVKKQDGSTPTWFHIAYHRVKLQRGYDLLIDVWGADHHGYIPRTQAAQAMAIPKSVCRSCSCSS